jgi:hypothetical protein
MNVVGSLSVFLLLRNGAYLTDEGCHFQHLLKHDVSYILYAGGGNISPLSLPYVCVSFTIELPVASLRLLIIFIEINVCFGLLSI